MHNIHLVMLSAYFDKLERFSFVDIEEFLTSQKLIICHQQGMCKLNTTIKLSTLFKAVSNTLCEHREKLAFYKERSFCFVS